MNSVTWTSVPVPTGHATLKSFEYAENCKTSSNGAASCTPTDDDRITFSKGGRIEDLPGEGGLLLTTPDGASKENKKTYGFVHHDDDIASPTYQEPAVYFNAKDASGDTTVWKQTFPVEGGTVLQYADRDSDGFKRAILVDSKGGMVAQFEDNTYFDLPSPQLSISEGSIVIKEDDSITLTPPVPLEWLVAPK